MTTAVAVAALLTGCGPEDEDAAAEARPAGDPAVSATSTPTPPTPEPTRTPTPTPTRTPTPTKATPTPAPPSPPPAPTTLSMYASTAGGRMVLKRGGEAQEFTVSVRNGNTRAYPHLRVALQMEMLFGEGPAAEANGLVLERHDPATGTWRPATDLRVANDVFPHYLYPDGTPLALDAARTDRYRLRALPEGPVGSTPLLIRLVDTSVPETAPDAQAVPRRTSLPVTVVA
ncbi:hypothetical protein [Streptomyces broussonetiae]|uniref:Secreted protein n=1 Tax=Streptomyces broussonetiae TaxID=2686304 RepID=A0ABV5EF27_9ACTN